MESLPTDPEELLRFVEALKAQWMATVDALADPLMIVGPDYILRKANLALANHSGMGVRDLIGKPCYLTFAKRDSPCEGCKMPLAASSGQSQTFDLPQFRSEYFMEVNSFPLFDAEGNVDGIVQTYRDRTEKKRFERQLVQSEKLASIGLLAGGLAHEINNPLGGILVFAEMLQRELPPESSHQADVEEILAATIRCKNIVESLLDFARAQPKSDKPSKQVPIDVHEAISTALRFAKVGIQKHLIDIEENYMNGKPTVSMDRNKLVQVILNFVQNAAQAMPDGGTIQISTSMLGLEESSKFINISVQDNGVGIPPENLKAIFDPFFTTKEPGEGTGLGLAICFGLVKEAGGNIDVESAINVGTIFHIKLPILSVASPCPTE